MKRCVKCVLSERTPYIEFDSNGICNYCKTYKQFDYYGEEKLQEILNRHRNASGNHDCIVNISGGRDSSYALLKLARDYGMKVLAVNYQNPFTHKQAKENIRNITQVLGVDLVQFKLKDCLHEEILKRNIKAWSKRPTAAMIPVMCVGCKIIWRKILKIARKYDIHLIVNGGNPLEYTAFKKELLKVSRDAGLKSTYLNNIRGLLGEVLKNISYISLKHLSTTIEAFLFANQYSIGSRVIGHRVEVVDLFHFVKWNEREVVSRIKTELNWSCPAEPNSTWRFDCEISHLKDYLYLKTIGMTEKDDFYSKMIREDLISREDALMRLKEENKLHMDTVETVLNKVRLNIPELSRNL